MGLFFGGEGAYRERLRSGEEGGVKAGAPAARTKGRDMEGVWGSVVSVPSWMIDRYVRSPTEPARGNGALDRGGEPARRTASRRHHWPGRSSVGENPRAVAPRGWRVRGDRNIFGK